MDQDSFLYSIHCALAGYIVVLWGLVIMHPSYPNATVSKRAAAFSL